LGEKIICPEKSPKTFATIPGVASILTSNWIERMPNPIRRQYNRLMTGKPGLGAEAFPVKDAYPALPNQKRELSGKQLPVQVHDPAASRKYPLLYCPL
jgi:hypothetical protein